MPVNEDLELLVDAAREAAAVAKRAYEDGTKSWNKPGGSPVTEADLAVDALLKSRLRAARPDYGWLSEETPDDDARLVPQRTFIIDPIDGTRAFVKRRPNWTISLAVAENGKPVTGVVIAPMLDELYSASHGGGAQLTTSTGTVRIHASTREALAGARLVGPQDAFTTKPGGTPWPEIVRDSFSSLAYRVCLVAAGERDGTVSLGSFHEWDVAAADLLLTEAHGRLSQLSGAPLRYNKPSPVVHGLIAAGPRLYGEILARFVRG